MPQGQWFGLGIPKGENNGGIEKCGVSADLRQCSFIHS